MLVILVLLALGATRAEHLKCSVDIVKSSINRH